MLRDVHMTFLFHGRGDDTVKAARRTAHVVSEPFRCSQASIALDFADVTENRVLLTNKEVDEDRWVYKLKQNTFRTGHFRNIA